MSIGNVERMFGRAKTTGKLEQPESWNDWKAGKTRELEQPESWNDWKAGAAHRGALCLKALRVHRSANILARDNPVVPAFLIVPAFRSF